MKHTLRAAVCGVLAAVMLCGSAFAATAGGAVIYKVKSGDTLWAIARGYSTSVTELMRINGLTSDLIMPGMLLIVSSPAAAETKVYIEYTIRRGDTLGKIAEAFGVEMLSMRVLNGISGDKIYAGDTIKVPADYFEYTVKSGDTLWALGQHFGVGFARIMVYSGIDSADLRVGQILKVPAAPEIPQPPAPAPAPTKPTVTYSEYYVARGDTIWDISVRFGIPMTELLSDNNLTMESVLNLGQKLKIARHTVPVKSVPSAKYGEYLDWWTEAQYVVPIGKTVKIVDFDTGASFTVKRTIGAGHADSEPLTSADTAKAKTVFGGYTWTPRAVIVEVDGRRIAGSMSFYPHDVESITDNGFNGHFDLYFANCIRHADGKPDPNHQKMVEKAAGV
ncbi:MAG: LysM peptidoglycan-binding domain-containing protein [Oscillospiraceae bacterium]|jgi:LysM repeat protein|nr:LysM peptidoglycan-binding domain-containing protein [Oscillospiraceae bacterium]